ncbi:MAG: molybdopterin-dependent oxidoreductase, partial [Chloroflexi bacterium]|nr:molybdopterin-dependent oxidoreductase [Chloroflexota bacterium]
DVSPHGQGTATSFSQIAADTLGIPPEMVELHHGDTDELASGGGTTSSRGLAVGGNAAYMALQEVKRRLDAAGGVIPANGITVELLWELPANPFGFAAHVAVVELDEGTGDVRLTDYAAVHDCGPMINPVIVRGQIQGGIAQGIGQALSEGMLYSAAGQPQTASFMTYGIPIAESLPEFLLENQQTPSPTNPLGIKGIGELPTVAAPVAVTNAVADALARSGADVSGVDMPLLAERVWRALG